MKIDLHCHTKRTKKEESDLRNVSVEKFKEKVEQSEVKLLAITNHNRFFKDNYLELKDAVKESCYVIPGIELDVEGFNKSKGHVILIASPDDVDEFENRINQITQGFTPDNFIINSHELYNIFKDMDIIYIAHCLKNKQLSSEDLDDFQNIMDNKKRLLKEASNIVSIGILQSNNHRAMIGTDVIDWNNYENYSFGNLKFDIKDYKSLIKLVDKNIELITDLINENFDEKIMVYGKSKEKQHPFTIPIYDDINIIFGDKGSGKSEIIESLYNYYNELGNEPIMFVGGDKSKWYEEKTRVSNEDYTIEKIGLSNDLSSNFKFILDYKDTIPTKLKSYYIAFKNKSTNKNKDKMKCLKIAKEMNFDNTIYKKLFTECNRIKSFIREIKDFEYSKNHSEEIENIILTLNQLADSIYSYYKKIWLFENSKLLLDKFVDKMNNYVSQCTGTPSLPSTTGLYKFASNRIKLKYNINILIDTLNTSQIQKVKEYVGKLGNKGAVYLTTSYYLVNKMNIDNIDYHTLKFNKGDLSKILCNLDYVNKNIYLPSMLQKLEDVKSTCLSKKILDIHAFISISKSFTIDNKKYVPSKGELSILSLQNDFIKKQQSKDVFLLDEPESNLSSDYINEEIVPLLKNLANSKKKVIVATHDANIAIRTRPSNTILKIVNNQIYETYVGNMFTNKLINIDNKNELDWKIESLKYLEGGKDAFDERGDLYE